MKPETVNKRITDFGYTLLSEDVAIDARSHIVKKISSTTKRITWFREKNLPVTTASPLRIVDYMALLRAQDYSYLLSDGGIVQIAYEFEGSDISKHRLAYYPCPFNVPPQEIRQFEGGFHELLEDSYMDDQATNVVLRSPIRFDYAPSAASEFHPASHLTFNDSSCRIPARSPLAYSTFMKFILENFYINAWKKTAVKKQLVFALEGECLSHHDGQRAFLNWQYA